MEEIELHYELGPDVYLAQSEITDARSYSEVRLFIVRQQTLLGVVLIAAAIAAFKAQFIAVLLFSVVMLAVVVFKFATLNRTLRKTIAAWSRTMPRKTVRLAVREDGIVETVEGIVSFAPWASVVSYVVFRGNLFIQLKAGLWALIPGEPSVTPESRERIIESLKAHSIPLREQGK